MLQIKINSAQFRLHGWQQIVFGGPGENRTPVSTMRMWRLTTGPQARKFVRPLGIEPRTLGLRVLCSAD